MTVHRRLWLCRHFGESEAKDNSSAKLFGLHLWQHIEGCPASPDSPVRSRRPKNPESELIKNDQAKDGL
ncbi:MAG: hypothetical protein CVV64_16525 [Candidatus Wallbacteria bacterium HGW-Wallbacteria-1]|uniref:Uncharacterized protein n=1 Tax=Candidatus Wallbacteria bacterium HGW-Wallbacteria-1 TaxID=2013854 RepID=A0A2N1PKQ5_9BACT|nr:MAG: hypothetical protein CVV64_16525 [Candidatus Wallbacteria bacterium HGW-Wallbacteria-1]